MIAAIHSGGKTVRLCCVKTVMIVSSTHADRSATAAQAMASVPIRVLSRSRSIRMRANTGKAVTLIAVPIWFPLVVILGVIVIREERWRVQRAKAAEDAAPCTPF